MNPNIHEVIHPELPSWLTPKRISSRDLASTPLKEYERGQHEWEQSRGHELNDQHCDYGYYIGVLDEQLDYNDRGFGTAESVREDIREAPSSTYLWWQNTPPTETLKMIAYRLGYRLVPFARWAGMKLDRPDIPRDVEAACRKLAIQADSYWTLLMERGNDRLQRESASTVVSPLLHDAHSLERSVFEELWQYGELVDSLRPYYKEIMTK